MSKPIHEPNVQVFTNKKDLARAAAELFSTLATEAVAERGRFSVALAGGSTPQALFSILAAPPYITDLPWPSSHIFWGDERLVPPDDPGSNFYHAAKLLLNHIDIPPANIHRVKGELSAAEAVEGTIEQLQHFAEDNRQWPRFDLVLLGMGGDGHTASLFPGSPALEPDVFVKPVTAVYENRPAQRITLTPALFNDARQILFLVTGANKAEALAAVLQDPPDWEKWPAQRIQPNSGVTTWFVDQEAASLLEK
jgi:6-phosphogluconolactonase